MNAMQVLMTMLVQQTNGLKLISIVESYRSIYNEQTEGQFLVASLYGCHVLVTIRILYG